MEIKMIISCLGAVALLFCGSVLAQNAPASQSDNFLQSHIIPPVTPSDNNTTVHWDTIPWKNILWKKRVWRDLDIRKKENSAFGYTTGKPGSRSLISILISGIVSGQIKAYSAADDRFTTVLSKDEFIALVSAKGVTENITGYRIKEDWIFTNLMNDAEITVRLCGLAPTKEVIQPDGTLKAVPLFWIYYPDCRSFLARFNVVNNSGNGANFDKEVTYNWNEHFEARRFDSKVDKINSWQSRTSLPK
jgi:gliding motility associated protien GldN